MTRECFFEKGIKLEHYRMRGSTSIPEGCMFYGRKSGNLNEEETLAYSRTSRKGHEV